MENKKYTLYPYCFSRISNNSTRLPKVEVLTERKNAWYFERKRIEQRTTIFYRDVEVVHFELFQAKFLTTKDIYLSDDMF